MSKTQWPEITKEYQEKVRFIISKGLMAELSKRSTLKESTILDNLGEGSIGTRIPSSRQRLHHVEVNKMYDSLTEPSACISDLDCEVLELLLEKKKQLKGIDDEIIKLNETKTEVEKEIANLIMEKV